jgi:hypothetical protein
MLSGPQSVQEWAACNPNLLTSTRTTSSPHATTLHQLRSHETATPTGTQELILRFAIVIITKENK